MWQSIENDCTVILVERRADNIWRPMALVLHEELGGKFHFDWLLGRVVKSADSDARVVRTFRTTKRVDQAIEHGGMAIQPIADHRWLYLHLPQPHTLSDERGTVTPLARGWWRAIEGNSDSLDETIEIRWDGDPSTRRCRITPPPNSRLFAADAMR